jgi:hypothetical protein
LILAPDIVVVQMVLDCALQIASYHLQQVKSDEMNILLAFAETLYNVDQEVITDQGSLPGRQA